MKQRFMLDTNAVRVLLERRSPQLDQTLIVPIASAVLLVMSLAP